MRSGMNLRRKPGRAVMTVRSRSIIGAMSRGETVLEIAKSQVKAAPASAVIGCCNGSDCSVMSAAPGLRAVRLQDGDACREAARETTASTMGVLLEMLTRTLHRVTRVLQFCALGRCSADVRHMPTKPSAF